MPTGMKGALTALMWVAFWVMTLFFMIPVGMVQACIEVPRLSSYPVIGGFVSNIVVTKLLQSIVPGLALKIFLALVPPLIRLMLKIAGAVSENELDMGTVSRFFLFQVVVVFFGTVIMGSFFNQVTQWIASPFSVISILGTSIPMVSTFFCNYILINALMVQPIAFLRLPGYVIFWLKSKFSGSPKARDRLWQEQFTLLGTTVVYHTIVVLLGLVYSSINPIITVFSLVYFCVVLLIERYQAIYVVRRNYESAGKLWEKVFGQVLVALYIKLITMLGLLGIKKFTGAPALIPLLIIVLIFHFVVSTMLKRPWQFMSMHDGADLDEMDKEGDELGGDEEDHASFERDAYLSPYFKVKPGQLDPLFAEAASMREKIALAQEEGAKPETSNPSHPQPQPQPQPTQEEIKISESPLPPSHTPQTEDEKLVIYPSEGSGRLR
jgi:hypothetical protein